VHHQKLAQQLVSRGAILVPRLQTLEANPMVVYPAPCRTAAFDTDTCQPLVKVRTCSLGQVVACEAGDDDVTGQQVDISASHTLYWYLLGISNYFT